MTDCCSSSATSSCTDIQIDSTSNSDKLGMFESDAHILSVL